MSTPSLTAIVSHGIGDTPTTLFFSRTGKLVHTQIGQYLAQGSLDSDIKTYALRG
jgi:hypothetical protein